MKIEQMATPQDRAVALSRDVPREGRVVNLRRVGESGRQEGLKILRQQPQQGRL